MLTSADCGKYIGVNRGYKKDGALVETSTVERALRNVLGK